MQNTPENYALVLDSFDKLSWMKGYPELDKQIEQRVLRLLNIVRNKTALQCILDACLECDNKYTHDNFLWDHEWDGQRQKFHGRHTQTFGSAEKNDLDWIIERIGEECDELPTQRGIREMYGKYLLPADGKRVGDFGMES
jgi:hypothetical protein